MHPNEIRDSFLKYFERHGHRVVSSSPLVPSDDPTLLFTNAGMNQFKDVFLGREKREYARAATSQKCMRVSGKHNDLDNVGPSLRHHTFFEMLGNFSFGDYFKADAIPFAWKLLTEEWHLDPKRLVATIFKGEHGIPRDDEAYSVWHRFLPAGQIGELGMADNFWAMGDTGPCGRCSEIYYDRGDGVPGTGHFMTDAESGSERFVEIWNNVFMEFERKPDGTLLDLPARSIDTGMGLERIAAVMIGSLSNYDTELFQPILRAIGSMASREHGGTMEAADVSMRVVADHIRAMTFLIADGVVPSNEWRGYVLRKIMRRAMRHGRKLGFVDPFLFRLVDVVVTEMRAAYPELEANRDAVVQVVRSEEERFGVVLTEGLPRLEDVLEQAARGSRIVAGDQAFKLYDTYGLPRDFIEDLASAQGLQFDAAGFERAMEGQREQARARSAFGGGAAVAWNTRPGATDALNTADTFSGYDHMAVKTQIVELLKDNGTARDAVEQLNAGEAGFVALAETPFYVESGGQVSDVGRLESNSGEALVTGVVRGPSARRFHRVEVQRGSLKYREFVEALVDEPLRDATRRNHTATHLLHAALRQVLGTHVKQAGSLVAPDRLRFDFVHFSALTSDEIARIERRVTERIIANTPVHTDLRNTQEAIDAGAMALFGEKYGDRVRVVTVPGFSIELCGGTHVRATGDLGPFFITEESGVAAGVRRIEAVTGLGASSYVRERLTQFDQAVRALNAKPQELAQGVETQVATVSRLRKEIQQLKTRLALGGGGPAAGDGRVEIGGVTLITREVLDVDKESLRSLADQLKSTLESGIVILASPSAEGKVTIIATVTPDLTKRAPAGQLVKQLAPIVGGGGGGRPDFAEAGGKDPSKIAAMLAEGRQLVEALLART
ncbi:MAG TPA: alanine--tRNA ligase [Vicinamibacterales bacterium]|nr:alanine--tRNA ligase [Vicinamibacterales bacterium]